MAAEKTKSPKSCMLCRNYKALWKSAQPCKRCHNGTNYKSQTAHQRKIDADKQKLAEHNAAKKKEMLNQPEIQIEAGVREAVINKS